MSPVAAVVARSGLRRADLWTGLLSPPVGLVYAAVGISGIVSATRLLLFVHQYGENVLVGDQWNYYGALFQDVDVASLWMWQQGPHRMGLGNLFLKVLATLTRWDGRAEAYEGWAALALSACLALVLKRRVVGRWHLADAVIPVLVLTPMQHELLVLIPLPTVSFLPLVLLLLTALVATAGRRRLRYAGLAVLNFLAVYTGYGLFVGFITPLVILTDRVNSRRARWGQAAAFLVTATTTASFFFGYHFGEGVAADADCSLLHPSPADYAGMLTLFYNSPLGLPFLNPSAYVALVGLLATGAWSARRALTVVDRQRFLPLAILFGYTFLVALSVIWARACVGVGYGQAPRYITYMIPTWLALYVALYLLPQPSLRRALPIGFAVVAIAILSIRSTHLEPSLWMAAKKTEWKDCYLQSESAQDCDQAVGFSIFPRGSEGSDDEARLTYLRTNRLNMFNGSPSD